MYINYYSEENMYKYFGEFAKNIFQSGGRRVGDRRMQWMPFKLVDEMKLMDEICQVRKNVDAAFG